DGAAQRGGAANESGARVRASQTLIKSISPLGNIITSSLFSLTAAPPTAPSTLSLHDALPISPREPLVVRRRRAGVRSCTCRNEQIGRDTSELQSRSDLVCRLLLEKKKILDSGFTIMRDGSPKVSKVGDNVFLGRDIIHWAGFP